MLLCVLLLFTGLAPNGYASTKTFDAAVIDGNVYVAADQIVDALGGRGVYDEKAKQYIYSPNSVSEVIEAMSPSVVAIIGRPAPQDDDVLADERFSLSHGTGVILSDDGWIVTNAHVVKDLAEIVVVTSDGKQFTGRTHALDEESDLALVKVNALKLRAATLASSAVRVGETVVAIGTPISFALRNTATVGVVSGVDRSLNSTYQLLQTDAAINPGNSGGPLVNLQGEVVGINTLKYVDYGIESMGFAIPVSTVNYVSEQLRQYGVVQRPYLGADLTESWAAVVGLPTRDPLNVDYVETDGPAHQAGIRAGDQLLALDGKSFSTLVEYNEILKAYSPGSAANFQVISGDSGKVKDATVTFGSEPGQKNRTSEQADVEQYVDIWAQIDYNTVLINGKKHVLEPPTVWNGHTLVPLELFTLAYGEHSDQTVGSDHIVLTLGEHRFSMTFGQTTASVDGEQVELPVAPSLNNGTPMVPFRFIAEQLGMTLDYFPTTREMTISGQLDEDGRFSNTSDLNRDSGKTKVGDSFYGWTMQYPANLIVSYQDETGESVSFYDINGEYSLNITVESLNGSSIPSEDALLNKLTSRSYGQMMARSYVRDVDLPYARTIVKSYGGYEEGRAYANEDYIYFVTMTVYSQDDFTNESKSRAYQRILNSFRIEYDNDDESIKNLAKMSDGYRTFSDSNLGISFSLPVAWYRRPFTVDDPVYVNMETYEESLAIRLRSVADGDTLDEWVARRVRMFEMSAKEEYRKIGEPRETTVSGLDALHVRYDFSSDLKTWERVESIFVFVGNYKFEFIFKFPHGYDRDADQIVERFIETLNIKSEHRDSVFGIIEDEIDSLDMDKTVTITNTDHNMMFEVPEYWEGDYYTSDEYTYYFGEGVFEVYVDEYETFEEAVKELDEMFSDDEDEMFKLLESVETTVSGAKAKKWVIELTIDSKRTFTEYRIDYDDKVYSISYWISEATSTPENLNRLEAAVQSFTFTK